MINKVILLGNLGKDPEIRHLESGASVARFPMATSRSYRDKAGEWQTITTWHDIVAWRNLAERVERDLKKGSLVFVEGELNKRKYQDREGNDRYAVEVVAFTVKLLEKREPSTGSFPSAGDDPFTATAAETNDTGNNGAEGAEDDLPF